MPQFIRVQSAAPLDVPRIRVVFTNGEQREIDLTPYIATGPIFEPVRTNPLFFQSVEVDGVSSPNLLGQEGLRAAGADRVRMRSANEGVVAGCSSRSRK